MANERAPRRPLNQAVTFGGLALVKEFRVKEPWYTLVEAHFGRVFLTELFQIWCNMFEACNEALD